MNNIIILNNINVKSEVSGFVVYRCFKHGIFFKNKKSNNKKCPYKNCDNKDINKLYEI